MALTIRPEQPNDEQTIRDLTIAAFEPMLYSGGSEAPIIEGLRADGDLTISLVAIEGTDILGHIAFSPVSIEDCEQGWFGLGPVSVRPEHQRQGIGSALINAGLDKLRTTGARGCVLIGDPAFYRQFGFLGDGRVSYAGLPNEVVQWLSFDGEQPLGRLRYSPAFEQQGRQP